MWKDKVDKFGGIELDAAVNIILLDDYFDKELFQRDKFKAAIAPRPVTADKSRGPRAWGGDWLSHKGRNRRPL